MPGFTSNGMNLGGGMPNLQDIGSMAGWGAPNYSLGGAPSTYGTLSPSTYGTLDAGAGLMPQLGGAPDAAAGGIPDWLSMKSFLGGSYKDGSGAILQQGGWGAPALGVANSLMNTFMGMKQYGLYKDQLSESKRQFGLNYDAQRQTTNTALQDRQTARVASNPGAYQSVGDYMASNGIGNGPSAGSYRPSGLSPAQMGQLSRDMEQRKVDEHRQFIGGK